MIKRICISLLLTYISISCLQAQINLPVEISTINGKAVNVNRTINLTANQATLAKKLWIKVHNLRYQEQAYVRVGTAPWEALKNSNADISVIGQGAKYGGIGGGFNTIEIEVDIPAGALKAGDNILRFQQSGHNSVTNGFRVLELNLRNSAGNNMLGPNRFKQTNPDVAVWGITNNQNNRNAGKAAWEARNTLIEYPGGPAFKASCADCHTKSGSDMKYFGYSNASIIRRGRFHGLTDTKARQIAVYLRNLPNVEAHGRPWNPPYQPAPGLGNEPVEKWAAGGGLDAVLEKDEDMLPHLFPNGTGQGAIDAVINTDVNNGKPLRLYELPIAIQMPDWNSWLPIVAPQDMWDGSTNVPGKPNNFVNSDMYKAYQDARSALDSNGTNYYLANDSRRRQLIALLDKTNTAVRDHLAINTSARDNSGPYVANATVTAEEAKRYSFLWNSVKLWELMTDFKLENKGPRVFNMTTASATANNGNYGQGEPRMWPMSEQAVHGNAPHITSYAPGSVRHFNNWVGQDPLVGDYVSSSWYHLQAILNSGTRQRVKSSNFRPVDWIYGYSHINDLWERSGEPEPLRYIALLAKAYEARDTGVLSLSGISNRSGWVIRSLHPWLSVVTPQGPGGDNLDEKVYGETRLLATLNDYQTNLWPKIVNSFIKEWVDVSSQFSSGAGGLPKDQWTRKNNATARGQSGWIRVMPPNAKPIAWGDSEAGFTKILFHQWEHMDGFWRLIPYLKDIGCNTNRINNLISWCEDMWPGPANSRNNWAARGARSPLPYQNYVLRNQHQSKIIKAQNNSTNPRLVGVSDDGHQSQWRIMPVGDNAWSRLEREQTSPGSTLYWLRAIDTNYSNGQNQVERSTSASTGDQTQWRSIYLGGGRHRVESKYLPGHYLLGRNDGNVSAHNTTNRRVEWTFLNP